MQNKNPVKSVLIVEDDPLQQLQLSAILNKLGQFHSTYIDINVSSNLSDAMQSVRHKKYDLILADLILEKGELGLDLLQHCQEDRKCAFVVTSGKNDVEIARLRKANSAPFLYISKFKPLLKYMANLESFLFTDTKIAEAQ